MGTPDFAVPTLEALLAGPDEVVGVFTQPDRPAGRGLRLAAPPVKELASAHGLPVLQPARMKDPEVLPRLREWRPDLIVVVAYGRILPREVLELPLHGCVNVHASLLPRWRGAAPIQRALLAGDAMLGVSIMAMEAGLDTGPILSRRVWPVHGDESGGEMHDRLAKGGGELLAETVEALQRGGITPRIQPEEGVTYAEKLTAGDEILLWENDALQERRRILALSPWPGARTGLKGERLKVLGCRPGRNGGPPGTVTALHADGPEVACGEGSLVLTEVQPAGKRRLSAGEWLRGRPLKEGDRLQPC
ncbi:MAG: methionyl-tRNA formyltransferase [Magnetococcales bacterium]|nr:methionyl-tRNA formyltransferase [Magnetococcales bacterium]